jgi:hypothetical protein
MLVEREESDDRRWMSESAKSNPSRRQERMILALMYPRRAVTRVLHGNFAEVDFGGWAGE